MGVSLGGLIFDKGEKAPVCCFQFYPRSHANGMLTLWLFSGWNNHIYARVCIDYNPHLPPFYLYLDVNSYMLFYFSLKSHHHF